MTQVISSKKGLSKHVKKQLIDWSLEAHKLDPSKTTREYYKMFLERLRVTYKTSKDKEQFIRSGIIEND